MDKNGIGIYESSDIGKCHPVGRRDDHIITFLNDRREDVEQSVLTAEIDDALRHIVIGTEVSRVLRPDGKYLLKISGVRWYLLELRQALKSGKITSMIHATRVLVAGSIYHLTRRQPRSST